MYEILISLDMWPDLLTLRAVEVLADVHLPVELQHGLRVGLEHLQPVPHRLRLVVLPLHQRLSGLVILPGNLKIFQCHFPSTSGLISG